MKFVKGFFKLMVYLFCISALFLSGWGMGFFGRQQIECATRPDNGEHTNKLRIEPGDGTSHPVEASPQCIVDLLKGGGYSVSGNGCNNVIIR